MILYSCRDSQQHRDECFHTTRSANRFELLIDPGCDMEYQIIENNEFDIIEVATMGPFDMADHKLMVADIQKTRFFQSGKPLLIDHSNSPVRGLTNDQIRILGNRANAFSDAKGERKCAIVVSQGTIEFGLGRMWQGHADHTISENLQIFLSREAAIAWLVEADPTP